MASCQNYGPFLGTLNKRCRIIIGTQKGTIILTTTQLLCKRGTCAGLTFDRPWAPHPQASEPKPVNKEGSSLLEIGFSGVDSSVYAGRIGGTILDQLRLVFDFDPKP